MVSLKTDVNSRMLQAFRKGAVVILIGKIKNFFSNKKKKKISYQNKAE